MKFQCRRGEEAAAFRLTLGLLLPECQTSCLSIKPTLVFGSSVYCISLLDLYIASGPGHVPEVQCCFGTSEIVTSGMMQAIPEVLLGTEMECLLVKTGRKSPRARGRRSAFCLKYSGVKCFGVDILLSQYAVQHCHVHAQTYML